jgi:hypothetical protein
VPNRLDDALDLQASPSLGDDDQLTFTGHALRGVVDALDAANLARARGRDSFERILSC